LELGMKHVALELAQASGGTAAVWIARRSHCGHQLL
jgi:hypothetical protein